MIELIKATPAFPVREIDKAVQFYKDKFGFDCRHKEDTFAILVRGNIELHLWASCNYSWKWKSIFLFLKPISSGAESFLAGTHSCRIEVKGVEELYKELKEKEVLHNEKTEIESTYYGTREFAALDLYGNLLSFYENV
ncbi:MULTISPECIES: bleomycin resistance protein [Chryseobacterium group]|nr:MULTISPECIES: VOC family protein [Chryseobacterium group]MBW3523292.1 VOC family protein [Chryseobacterium sp. NKUCC03_KSP]MEA1848403.1 VOC family protein [Chryseobacterium sp. MHB01]MEC3874939.1 VOC family protein [Chryseobacterium sp. T9W2-O]